MPPSPAAILGVTFSLLRHSGCCFARAGGEGDRLEITMPCDLAHDRRSPATAFHYFTEQIGFFLRGTLALMMKPWWARSGDVLRTWGLTHERRSRGGDCAITKRGRSMVLRRTGLRSWHRHVPGSRHRHCEPDNVRIYLSSGRCLSGTRITRSRGTPRPAAWR